MVRHHLGALALLAAFAMPLAASAQTFPNPGAPGSAPSFQQQQQQQPGAGHHRARNPYMRAMRGLGLSPAQQQQIAGIMKSSREAERRQIEGVLTPDQRTRFQAQLAQARRMKPNGPRQAPAQ